MKELKVQSENYYLVYLKSCYNLEIHIVKGKNLASSVKQFSQKPGLASRNIPVFDAPASIVMQFKSREETCHTYYHHTHIPEELQQIIFHQEAYDVRSMLQEGAFKVHVLLGEEACYAQVDGNLENFLSIGECYGYMVRTFQTEAERAAYLLGMQDHEDWCGHSILDENEDADDIKLLDAHESKRH